MYTDKDLKNMVDELVHSHNIPFDDGNTHPYVPNPHEDTNSYNSLEEVLGNIAQTKLNNKLHALIDDPDHLSEFDDIMKQYPQVFAAYLEHKKDNPEYKTHDIFSDKGDIGKGNLERYIRKYSAIRKHPKINEFIHILTK